MSDETEPTETPELTLNEKLKKACQIAGLNVEQTRVVTEKAEKTLLGGEEPPTSSSPKGGVLETLAHDMGLPREALEAIGKGGKGADISPMVNTVMWMDWLDERREHRQEARARQNPQPQPQPQPQIDMKTFLAEIDAKFAKQNAETQALILGRKVEEAESRAEKAEKTLEERAKQEALEKTIETQIEEEVENRVQPILELAQRQPPKTPEEKATLEKEIANAVGDTMKKVAVEAIEERFSREKESPPPTDKEGKPDITYTLVNRGLKIAEKFVDKLEKIAPMQQPPARPQVTPMPTTPTPLPPTLPTTATPLPPQAETTSTAPTPTEIPSASSETPKPETKTEVKQEKPEETAKQS